MGGRAASHSGVELAIIDTVDGAGGAQRLRPRRFRALLGVVPLACGLLLALGMQSSDAFATSWTPGVEPSPPANARSNPDASPLSVSCGSAGNCSAVGSYADKSGNYQGLLLSETAGTWAPGVGATLPAGGSSLSDLIPVSCASAGNCSAVGEYNDTSGNGQGLLLTETAGAWAPGVKAPLPAGSASNPKVSLDSVSCASPGNCSAVGKYTDGAGHVQGLLLTEAAGSWTGIEYATIADAASNPDVRVESVSCASPGNCSAVGNYHDNSSPPRLQGLLLTESGGFWDLGDKAPLPAGAGSSPNVYLHSVSCSSVGNCSAVGDYADNSVPSHHQQGLLLTETAGTWAAVKATLPAGTATDPRVDLGSVSCTSAGNCSAVGGYKDSASQRQGLLLTETAGTWAPGVKALPPADAATEPDVFFYSLSCTSAGNCSAVGDYKDSAGHYQALALTETAGTWATGVKAILPADAATSPDASLESVSCASAGNCSAVGYYYDKSSHAHGLLVSTLRRLTLLKAGSGRGSVTSLPASIHCGARCSHGFASGKLVTLTSTPARGSWFAGWSGACSGRGACRVKMTTERTVTAHFALLPDTKITKVKIDKAHQRAKFGFKALGKATGFQCALVKKHRKAKKHKKPKPHFSSCRSPKTYTSLAAGRYTFFVRAFNAGGPDPSPAKKSFKL